MVDKIGRRQFLHISSMAAAGAAVVACQAQTVVVKETVEVEKVVKETVQVEVEKEVTKIVEVDRVSSRQAPALQEAVQAGTLPPLEDRLPVEPKILSLASNEVPVQNLNFEIGEYGGTLQTVQPSPTWNPDIFVGCFEPFLYAPELMEGIAEAVSVGGNVVRDYQVSEDGKVFTFQMREGLKWSDGEPVTSEDVRFVWEDVLQNEDLTPSFPQHLRAAHSTTGEPAQIEILDDYTFRISFAEPYPGFSSQLGSTFYRGYTDLLKPRHFLEQFHTTYTPLAELEPLITEASIPAGEWWVLFSQKDVLNWSLCDPKAIDFPGLYPWLAISSTETATTYDRNPYYFKVDADGKQLPYIDGLYSAVVADVDMSTLKVMAGEVDFLREDTSLNSLALYKENAEKGGYQVVLLDMHVTPADVYINQTYDDPVWRQVVGDVRFREALSHAIDRAEVIDAIYFGFAVPCDIIPHEYDTDLANQLLDEMGMDQRDAEGFRLGPDGNPFSIQFDVAMHAPDIVPVTELVVEYFRAVGVDTTMQVIEAGLLGQRTGANEVQATVFWNNYPPVWWGALWDVIPSRWGQLWWQWYTSRGEAGEEPPEEVKALLNVIEELMVVAPENLPEPLSRMEQLLHDNIFIIKIAEQVKYPVIYAQGMGNIPHAGFAITANYAMRQCFFRQ